MEEKKNDYNIIIIDFEVLSEARFWMCCMKDVKTKKEHVIINDSEEFKRVFYKNSEAIWVGYNIKGYDQWIMRAILTDFDPFIVSDKIVKENGDGWNINNILKKPTLYLYELSNGERSLKELELFMGESIVESDIPFNLPRYPTVEEIEVLTDYCMHDVRMTYLVFEFLRHEFEAQETLIELFSLNKSAFSKTKAQISSLILEAKKPKVNRNDEFQFKIVNTLKLNKYDFIRQWYMNPENRDYNKKANILVYDVSTIFGWGGLHGARTQYEYSGIIINSDVASFYPAEMIEYNLLSRNVKYPEKFKEIRDMRLKFKAAKNIKQASLKIVLNSTYGASKDKFNELYDPQMANAICVNGQLLLLDLIEKVEEALGNEAILVQCNTDGVMFSFKTEESTKKYIEVCKEWSTRTKMELEHDKIEKVIQKDVNNYMYVTDTGKVKCKGAYVKELNLLDNDLPIVNRAIKEEILNGVPIEDTINNATELIDFQKCVKISRKYSCAMQGDEVIPLKVLRVFASKNATDAPITKVKKNSQVAEKIGNTPNKAFIINERIVGVGIPEKLDRSWYIDLAKKRLDEFKPKAVYEYTLLDLI